MRLISFRLAMVTALLATGCNDASDLAPASGARDDTRSGAGGTSTTTGGSVLSPSESADGDLSDPGFEGGDPMLVIDGAGATPDGSGATLDGAGATGAVTPEEGPGAGGASGAGGEAGAGGALVWPSEPIEPPPSATLEPGQLTAGLWDDNENFGFFARYQASQLEGQGTPLEGAMPIDPEVQQAAQAAVADERTPRQELDVALVVDTTGSMGDELEYLKVEFSALHRTILQHYPNSAQRWALLLYRDEGDLYVTRPLDFTDSAADFQASLDAQSSDGGGDEPEATDQALAEAATLSWRTSDDVARVMLWVADAPHHAERAQQMADAVLAVKDAGIHVYPVASSGANPLAELTMRQTAQLTAGRYLFLTDDSGIGNAHAEPTIPCYLVRLLADSVLRVVDAEMTGEAPALDLEDVVRIGGTVDRDGYCIYGSQQLYRPF